MCIWKYHRLVLLASEEDKVCLLRKAIYGLKQASWAWYIKIHDFLIEFGTTRSKADHNLYFNKEADLTLIVLIYVDDLLITGNNSIKVESLIKELEKKFQMSKLGLLTFYIGIEFQRLATGMLLFTELARKVWDVRMRTNGHTHGGGNQITHEHGGRLCKCHRIPKFGR